MKLPEEKQAALKYIEQYNNAVITCLKQNDIQALQETYEIRNLLIVDFFKCFSQELDVSDMEFFQGVEALDESVATSMKILKAEVAVEFGTRKKFKSGIGMYKKIANKNYEK